MAELLSLCPRGRERERERGRGREREREREGGGEEGEGPVLRECSNEAAHECSAVLLPMLNLEQTYFRAKEPSM